MAFALLAITFLSWMSLSSSTPQTCEELVRPLHRLDPQNLHGRWALIAGTMTNVTRLEVFRQRDSATVHFCSNTSEINVAYKRSLRIHNECFYSDYNISFDGVGFTYDRRDKNDSFSTLINTCPDCLLMRIVVDSGKQVHLYLFSKRRQLEAEEMEYFRAQVKCFNMAPPAVMDPTKELCPEQTSSRP